MSDDTTIHPFVIDVPQGEVDDLRARLAGTRWQREGLGEAWARGVPAGYLRGLAERWRDSDWRAHERALNALPQFTTQVDGQTLHAAHVRSPEPGALPLVLAHGYPSSFTEFTRVVGPLTDPRAHGGDPADAFHVVIPSVAGFAWSNPVTEPGWGVTRTGKALVEVMARLGYERYGAHGGDAGAGVVATMASNGPVVAVHTPTDPVALLTYGPRPLEDLSGLSERARAWVERTRAWAAEATGYLAIQTTRPQTIGYGFSDSPVAQLAWLAEKVKEWTDPAAALPEDAVGLDQLLTWAGVYWFTQSGATSAHFLYDGMHGPAPWGEHPATPPGMSVFGVTDDNREVVALLRGDNGAWWREHDRGGHFPALETPDLLVADLRDFFRDYR
jgi:epoxide hydrolase